MAMFESFTRQDLNALRFPSPDRRPRADAGRRERAKLAFAPGQDVLPVFGPKYDKLMWTSSREGRMPAQLYIADFTPPKE